MTTSYSSSGPTAERPMAHDRLPGTMLVGGQWSRVGQNGTITLSSPYDGGEIAEVAAAGPRDVIAAVATASSAMAAGDFELHERIAVLERAATLIAERREEIARTLATECAKPITTARGEVSRCIDTLRFAAAEARTLGPETVPVDASAAGAGKTAFVMRVPVGVVAAISPFNFPLNLVAHKLAPAVAAGCPVVLKPAGQTPLSALCLAAALVDAGLPAGWLNVIPGGGETVGEPLTEHPDVKYITFTGSPEVGWGIAARVPQKKVRLELGSNAPLIVDADSDWEDAAVAAGSAGFIQAGQSCVSTQRIFVHESIADRFTEVLVRRVSQLVLGEPLAEDTDVSALISPESAARVIEWIEEARAAGARVLIGGERVGNVVTPTVLTDVASSLRVQCEEVFGPVVTVTPFASFEDAISMANSSRFGLNAGVYTNNVHRALTAARELEFGGVYINDVPTVRADQQPYGGVKDSGNTREGPRYAIEEMTELRFVTLR